MDKVFKVLIVDDSAYVRKVVKQMLLKSPFLEVVGTARDGQEALALVEELGPDVITLDLMMPVLDGIGFLKEQMRRRPIPTVIVSISSDSGETALDAMDAGAVDFVQKPTALATEKVFDISNELVEKVKAAAVAHPNRFAVSAPAPLPSAVPAVGKRETTKDIVAIGISTGGPQALKQVIPMLPAGFPAPVVVVLHMPVGYTEMYAQRLNELSNLNVVEAAHGDELVAGRVYIAPAGQHLTFARAGGKVECRLSKHPFDALYKPSVDVMFQSISEVFGERALAAVMTGMGSDGQKGSAWIKAKGGRIFTQAEDSCVVYGMPRSVVEAGLSDRSVMLDRMAAAIQEEV